MKGKASTKSIEELAEMRDGKSATPSFADIARLITGDEPPPWLVALLPCRLGSQTWTDSHPWRWLSPFSERPVSSRHASRSACVRPC